jgi:hypothetical protein
MYLAVNLGGWVYPHNSATAAWTKDRIERPFVWTHCPFCNGALPLRRYPKVAEPSDDDVS